MAIPVTRITKADICLISEINFLYEACSSGSRMKVSRITRPTVVAAGEICSKFATADEQEDHDEEDDEGLQVSQIFLPLALASQPQILCPSP